MPCNFKTFAIGKIIALAQAPQVLHRHLARQVGAVTVPIEQIKRRGRLPHHVAFDGGSIDQVIAAQIGKGARHEETFKDARFLHLLLDPVDKIVVQEHADFALIGKIREGREKGRRID